jgi:hypothetical protein
MKMRSTTLTMAQATRNAEALRRKRRCVVEDRTGKSMLLESRDVREGISKQTDAGKSAGRSERT